MALSGMNWSLNEIEALVRKAARGSGASWGEAEETGRAVRWLCSQSIDGVGEYVAYLTQGPGSMLCPLKTGMAMVDTADNAANHPMGDIARPLLLLPFVARLAARTGRAWSLTSPTGLAAVSAKGTVILQGTLAPRVSLFAGGQFGTAQPRATRAIVSGDEVASLNQWAARTYAPATDESRTSGAGAEADKSD